MAAPPIPKGPAITAPPPRPAFLPPAPGGALPGAPLAPQVGWPKSILTKCVIQCISIAIYLLMFLQYHHVLSSYCHRYLIVKYVRIISMHPLVVRLYTVSFWVFFKYVGHSHQSLFPRPDHAWKGLHTTTATAAELGHSQSVLSLESQDTKAKYLNHLHSFAIQIYLYK